MTLARNVEGKYRTSSEVKARASEIYAYWGFSLSDAINAFLIKSVEVGGLPFDMRASVLSYERLAEGAYVASLNGEGVAVLPADWDDGDE